MAQGLVTFGGGHMVELGPEPGWGYLTGYLAGQGRPSTFFLDLRAVTVAEVH